MSYTIPEIIKYHAWDSLDSKQESELLNSIESYNDLVESIKCSEVTAGFIGEDEAHEPLKALGKYRRILLDGTKKERKEVMEKLVEDLLDIALSAIHSAEYGREEWNKIYKVVE